MHGYNTRPVQVSSGFSALTRVEVSSVLRALAIGGIALLLCTGMTGCKDKSESSSAPTGNGSSDTTTKSATTASPAGDEVVIGEYGSFTGPQADFGTQTDQGIQIAIDEVNAQGGIDIGGKKVKVRLEKEDDQSEAPKADTAVKRLIDEKNVTAVLGEVASSNSIAGGKVCQAKGVPMISPSSTNEAVTQIGDYIFRICFLDSYQAAVDARYALDGLKAKRAAVFTNKSQTYSVGFSNEFEKAFKKYGGQIVAELSYSEKDQDFSGPLNSIKAANPEVILIPGYYSDAGSIAKQARNLGITCPLLGGDGWDSEKLIEIGGDAMNNTFFSNHMSIKDPNPKVQELVKTYKAKYNRDPGALAALGYDDAKILFDAITRAGSTDKKAIRDAIANTRDFDGVTGKITIDPNRNAKKSAVIIAVKNKQFDYAATVPDPDQPLAPAKP